MCFYLWGDLCSSFSFPPRKARRDRDQRLPVNFIFNALYLTDQAILLLFMGCIQKRSFPLWIQWGSVIFTTYTWMKVIIIIIYETFHHFEGLFKGAFHWFYTWCWKKWRGCRNDDSCPRGAKEEIVSCCYRARRRRSGWIVGPTKLQTLTRETTVCFPLPNGCQHGFLLTMTAVIPSP